ncbi:MAG TPA: hypothetical protein VGI12_04160 [Vicinamibacterales bacterium]|jgi:hypothetical protein
MGGRLPGDRLRRVLAWCVDPQTFDEVIEPAIGDLQYEVEGHRRAGWRAWAVRGRGYWSVACALAGSGPAPSAAMIRLLALAALGVGGAALMTSARQAPGTDARPFVGAYLLPMFLAPVVLRRTGSVASYARVFAACAAVAFLAQGLDIGFYGLRGVLVHHERPVFDAGMTIDFVVFIATLSGIAALAAWQPAARAEPLPRTLVVALFAGGLTAAAGLGVAEAWRHPDSAFLAAARVPFSASVLAVLFAATAAPLLLARRWLPRPAALAPLAVALSPLTVLAQSYLDHGSVLACLDQFTRTPLAFAAAHLPVAAGAAVLGWRLIARPPRHRGALAA